jgi:hypothetical protein
MTKEQYINRPLMRYDNAEFLRLATQEEAEASDRAMARDGGIGAIDADPEGDGKVVTCYVPPEEE